MRLARVLMTGALLAGSAGCAGGPFLDASHVVYRPGCEPADRGATTRSSTVEEHARPTVNLGREVLDAIVAMGEE